MNGNGPHTSVKFTHENVFQVLQDAVKEHRSSDEINRIFEYVRQFFSFLIKTEGFMQINTALMIEILQRVDRVCSLFTGEVEIFNAVERAIEIKSESDQDYEDRRVRFKELIKTIRFPTMTLNNFVECMTKCEWMLTAEERSDIFMEICTNRANRHGFSRVKRIFEDILDESSVSNLEQITFYPCNRELDFANDHIPVMKTIFSLSVAAAIKCVRVFNGQYQNLRAVVHLKNQHGQTLTSGEGLIEPGYRIPTINFEQLICLNPRTNYAIEVIFDVEERIEYWCSPVRECPFTVMEGDAEIKFEQINPMIWGIVFCKL